MIILCKDGLRRTGVMIKEFSKDLRVVDIPKFKFIFAIHGKIWIDFDYHVGFNEQNFTLLLNNLSEFDI